jgi:diguanylate cyclase (GGDEF)-like protein
MLDASILSFILLVYMFIKANNRADRKFFAVRVFNALMIANMAMLVLDYLTHAFNGLPGTENIILNIAFNCLYFAVTPIAPVLWIVYLYNATLGGGKSIERAMAVLRIAIAVNLLLSVASIFTGWYFSIDAANVYSRGNYYSLYIALNAALIIYGTVFVLYNKNRTGKKEFLSLLAFFIPPFIGAIVSIIIPATCWCWIGLTISILIVYMNIQGREMNYDYLTGAYNRRLLDKYINRNAGNKVFSVILMDIDGLKGINDSFGHQAGDESLKNVVSITKSCIREDDFVARIGGDEFIVILDIQSADSLEDAVRRIECTVAEFNSKSGKPYVISLSFGYGIYDSEKYGDINNFFEQIDSWMYAEKAKKACIRKPA